MKHLLVVSLLASVLTGVVSTPASAGATHTISDKKSCESGPFWAKKIAGWSGETCTLGEGFPPQPPPIVIGAGDELVIASGITVVSGFSASIVNRGTITNHGTILESGFSSWSVDGGTTNNFGTVENVGGEGIRGGGTYNNFGSYTVTCCPSGSLDINEDGSGAVFINYCDSTFDSAQGFRFDAPINACPEVSIGDVVTVEGDAGTTDAVFSVSLSVASTGTTRVSAVTSAGTATPGVDYGSVGLTVLEFGAGETSQQFVVPVFGDDVLEADELFTVTLSAPVSATILDGEAVGTIANDDELSAIVSGPSVGAPGEVASFGVTINSTAGAATYSWEAVRTGVVVATGTDQSFVFTPGVGGTYFVSVEVTLSGGANQAVAVLYTVLGDVGESAFAADVVWMAAEGITLGCNPPANDEFCPNKPVTRGQMAAFLVRALGLTDRGTVDFIDDDGSIFEPDIEKLATAGITRGCNPPVNDRFCPNEHVTRGQMAAFLVRALGYTDNGGGNLFIDDDGSVFENDIDKLATADVTRGCNPPVNDRYCPDNKVTRGQMAAFLHRALG